MQILVSPLCVTSLRSAVAPLLVMCTCTSGILVATTLKHRSQVSWSPLVYYFLFSPLDPLQKILLLITLCRYGVYDRSPFLMLMMVVVLCFLPMGFEVLRTLEGPGTDCVSVLTMGVWVEISCWLQAGRGPEGSGDVMALVSFEQVLSFKF